MSKLAISSGKVTLFVNLAFGLALVVAGMMFQDRLGELLIAYTENQTRRQAETLASQAGEKLDTELKNLSYIASRIEASPDGLDQLMPMIYSESGIRQGLLAIDGTAVYGGALYV